MPVDLDREIDRAVRSMLDAEPPADLRGRVMASIQANDEPRRRWVSWAIPLASAAAVILAVMVFTRLPHDRPAQIVAGHDRQLPSPVARAAEQRAAIVTAPPVQPVLRSVPRRALVHATSLEEPAETGIDALAAPAPLSVGTLPAPASTTMPSIQPAPLRVNALDLPALEMPRDAARGEDR